MIDCNQLLPSRIGMRIIVALALLAGTIGTRFATAAAVGPEIVYFYTPTCPKCQQINKHLAELQKQHPGLTISKYNMSGDIENVSLLRQYYERFNVPFDRWNGTFAVFVGNKCYLEFDDLMDNIEKDILRLRNENERVSATNSIAAAPGSIDPDNRQGAERKIDTRPTTLPQPYPARREPSGETSTVNHTPPSSELETPDTVPVGDTEMIGLFNRFGLISVAGAGLIDGINPCAFGVLIFFFSYLTLKGRNRRDVLLTGLLFTLGVFTAYFLIGLGLMQAFFKLSVVPHLSKLLYPVLALFTLGMAVYTWFDYRMAQAGQMGEIKIKLPPYLLRAINAIIRHQMRMRYFVVLAFLTGLVVSMLELACTGQIYFPTIAYIVGIPALKVKAVSYLLLYVLMFILPLLGVFALVFYGVSSRRLVGLARANVARAKLLMFGLFLVLTLYMGYLSGEVFGWWRV